MSSALEEFVSVFANSRKTQFALLMGVTFTIGTMLMGDHFAHSLSLQGALAPADRDSARETDSSL
jgi:hypothetical protein